MTKRNNGAARQNKTATAERTNKNNGTLPRNRVPRFGRRRMAYEGAETSAWNQRVWERVDGLDINAALLPALETLRQRLAYERRQNGDCKSLIQSYADDIVGRGGPRLQITVDDEADEDFASTVEQSWERWTQRCDASRPRHLADMLRVLVKYWTTEGDFGIQLVSQPRRPGPIALRLLPIAPRRIATPIAKMGNEQIIEGVELDADDRPLRYYVKRRHPGDYRGDFGDEYAEIAARNFLLIFEAEEAGQIRGEPLLGSVIQLFPQVRQYVDYTLSAAEIAAMLAAYILYTDDAVTPDALDQARDAVAQIMDIEPGSLNDMPVGVKDVKQITPQHPSTKFEEFMRVLEAKEARVLGMPHVRATLNAKGVNFSGGRLIMSTYWEQAIEPRRGVLERDLLYPVFGRWLSELRIMTGLQLPRGRWRTSWVWDPMPVIDEVKADTASLLRIETGISSHEREAQRRNIDLEQVLRQEARYRQRRRELGLDDADTATADDSADRVRTNNRRSRRGTQGGDDLRAIVRTVLAEMMRGEPEETADE